MIDEILDAGAVCLAFVGGGMTGISLFLLFQVIL